MNRLSKTLTIAALGCSTLATALPASGQAAEATASGRDRTVVEWNRFLLDLQAAPGAQPAVTHPTYDLAMVHAAIYDAAVSIDHGGAPYLDIAVHAPRGASVAAAADRAAHDTLAALYPLQRAAIDQEYATQVAQVRPGPHRDAGERVGRRVAGRLLARRSRDGSQAAPLPFQPGTAPGDYQLTPPALAQPAFTQWPFVEPFALRRADQFRPGPPPPLTSPRYAEAIREVQTLGVAEGSTRTPDQTQIGQFWNAPIWATWNRIAETAVLAHQGGVLADARTFAALDLTLADSVIGFYDAKYAYRLWRPVTAIRGADADGNPQTLADPQWTPLSPTAADPSYPGAHGTVSAAAADVLASAYGDRFAFTVTSPVLPGVERSFPSFRAAAREATVSRIYNGNHTRIDQAAGTALGHHVARFVLGTDFRSSGAFGH